MYQVWIPCGPGLKVQSIKRSDNEILVTPRSETSVKSGKVITFPWGSRVGVNDWNTAVVVDVPNGSEKKCGDCKNIDFVLTLINDGGMIEARAKCDKFTEMASINGNKLMLHGTGPGYGRLGLTTLEFPRNVQVITKGSFAKEVAVRLYGTNFDVPNKSKCRNCPSLRRLING